MSDHEQHVLAEVAEMDDEKTDETRQGKPAKNVSFGDAVNELEAILRRIESEEIDIDQLAGELERATGLLEICRARVKKAEAEVTQVVKTLEAEPAAGGEDE